MACHRLFLLLSALLIVACSNGGMAQRPAAPYRLRCEYLENPIGLDTRVPRLSWALGDDRRGARQTAYQVLVAASAEDLAGDRGTVWDSGRVESPQSVLVPYGGPELRARQQYCWKVRAWDGAGVASPYSKPATWEMGLLGPEDWTARWISPGAPEAGHPIERASWIWHPATQAPGGQACLRTSLDIPEGATVTAASLRVAVDNEYTLSINGDEIGTGTEWRSAATYDVARALRAGRNAIALAVRNQDGPAGALLGLRVTYADGTKTDVVSDGRWRAAREPAEGWTTAAFDDSAWDAAAVVAPYGAGPWGDVAGSGAQGSSCLRKEFRLGGRIASARAYASGLGLYELTVNGQRAGDALLTPGWTYYPKHVQYQTYDVTPLLHEGANAVGAVLGNGWWGAGMAGAWRDGPPRFILQLEVRYADGRTETVVTDRTWRSHPSPVLEDSLYNGETYDARLEQRGWDEAPFDDAAWSPVEVRDAPLDVLVAQSDPLIRVTDELAPLAITQPAEGVNVVDFGQNLPGKARIRVHGPPGTRVQLRFAEVLRPDGQVYTDNYRSARATDVYILKGEGDEVWEPRFTYRGFRYAEVTGWPGELKPTDITARVLHSDAPFIGEFRCSDDLVNRIQHNVTWGQRSNMHSVPTDCPQRDERLGWMGDAQAFSDTSCWNMDMARFYSKWMRDIVDSQGEDGHVTDVAPTLGGGPAAPGWGDAVVVIPWTVYRFTGDTRIIEDNFAAMRAWVEYMRANAPGNLYEREGYGDWVAPVGSPTRPIGAAYYYYSTKLLADMAAAIGRTEDAATYAGLADEIAAAFNGAYFDAAANDYAGGTQTAKVLPLYFGLVPPERREAVAANLVADIVARDDHLSTGFLGTAYLMPVLSDTGHNDVAMKLALQRTYPSWGYMAEKGATTIWELWNSDTAGPGMNSRNHFALGAVGRWFYEDLAGIQPDAKAPGFRHIIIRPRPGDDLTWAEGTYQCVYGEVRSHWERRDDGLRLEVTVPANTTATIYIPAPAADRVTESGLPLAQAEGVTVAGTDGDAVLCEVGAGRYRFEVRGG